MRSVNEPSALVINPSNSTSVEVKVMKKQRAHKVNRNLFTVAKAKAVTLYEKVNWLADNDENEKKKLFNKCVKKAVNDIDNYNEAAFKKDMAMHMAFLLNDRRFQMTCYKADWSLFELSQKLCWTKADVFQKIRDYGIDQVQGFETPDILIYEIDDLKGELRSLGFDHDYFKDDPYTKAYKAKHPDQNGPKAPVAKVEAENGENKQDAGVEGDAPAA